MAAYHLIIDGYNLLHAAGLARKKYAQGELEQARENLLSLLRRLLSTREQEQTAVVFDAGQRDPSLSDHALRSGQIRILFSTQHGNADALIESLIEDHATPRKLTVISSDHRIQRCARLHHALFLDSESFLGDLLLRPPKRRKPLPPHPKQTGEMTSGELEYWLREFSGIDTKSHTGDNEPTLNSSPTTSSPGKSPTNSPSSKADIPAKSKSAPPPRKRSKTKFKAPGKGARRPPHDSPNDPPIFSSEWIAELQSWVNEQESKRK